MNNNIGYILRLNNIKNHVLYTENAPIIVSMNPLLKFYQVCF